MAHKGVREWTSEEISSVALGQNGFHILDDSGEVEASSKSITYWIAIKAVNGAAVVKAQSYGAGDDLSQSGAYAGTSITLADGDIVYGSFDKITVGSSDFVVAYIGK